MAFDFNTADKQGPYDASNDKGQVAADNFPAGIVEVSPPEKRYTVNSSGKIEIEGRARARREYPVHALGPIMRPFVKAMVNLVEVSPPLAAQSVLGAAALVAQQYVDIVEPFGVGGRMPCSLFLLTSAASGERKSSALSMAMSPISEWGDELAREYQDKITSYNRSKAAYEKLVSKVHSKGKNMPDILREIADIGPEPVRPLSPTFILTEPTIEGLLKSAQHGQGGRAIITAEAGAFLGGHSMTGDKRQHAITVISQLWDAETVALDRVGRETPPVKNRRHSFNLIAQPMIVNGFVGDAEAKDQGLLARFLTVEAPRRAGSRERLSPATEQERQAIEKWRGHILNTLRTRQVYTVEGTQNELKPRGLPLSPEAKKIWQAFHLRTERGIGFDVPYEGIAAFASKIGQQALRIAGVLTVIDKHDGADSIDAETMIRAVELADFYLDEQLRISERAGADPKIADAEKLINWIVAKREGYVYKADLKRSGPNRLRDADRLDTALETLCGLGIIARINPREIDGAVRQDSFAVKL